MTCCTRPDYLLEAVDMVLDAMCWGALQRSANLSVPWYLMASWRYYHRDAPLLSDSTFDRMAMIMATNWATIQHRHKTLITLDELLAGTLLLPDWGYPTITRDAADRLAREHLGG